MYVSPLRDSFTKKAGCFSHLSRVKKGGFSSSSGVQPQKVHRGAFARPFRVLSENNMTGDYALFQNWFFLVVGTPWYLFLEPQRNENDQYS